MSERPVSEPIVEVRALGDTDRAGFAALMDAQGFGCFCRYWHFTGTKHEWQARLAFEPERNEAEQFRDPCADDARGLVAYVQNTLVGWLKIAPHTALPKLLAQPVYKSTASPPDAHAVACFLVHPEWRRHGVARALLRAAPTFAREHGARWLYGYPRRHDGILPDAQALAGPETLFRELGFALWHDAPPYPIWRLAL